MTTLVCPVCHASLPEAVGASVTCPGCGRTYPERDGIMDFTPNPPPDEDVQARWPLWTQLQHNFLVAAEEIPEHSLSVGERPDARAFAEFAELTGAVLDVGCGTQREPSYAVGSGGAFVGIDPVRGERERDFQFVQGLGEYLPFPDGSFDRVLYATSLDHVLSPVRSLSEARRVLTPEGSVNIWFGEVDDDRPAVSAGSLWNRAVNVATHPRQVMRDLLGRPAAQMSQYERDLQIPEGAIDLFHTVHLSRPLISQWLEQAGLAITDAGQHGSSVFLRAAAAR